MKAIETEYNGFKFRSRVEARYAVFMDALGVKYEYEKEGFELGAVGRYLPDFWLPEQNCWVEIKGAAPDQLEINKARALNEHTDHPVFLFSGPPEVGLRAVSFYLEVGWNGGGYVTSQDGYDPGVWAYCAEHDRFLIRVPREVEKVLNVVTDWRGAVDSEYNEWCSCNYDIDWASSHPGIVRACKLATSARFEFGQTPTAVRP